MDSEKALRQRILFLEGKLFESHIGVCWGSPNCRCHGSWCRCPHRQVMAQLPKCCPECQVTLRRAQEAREKEKSR